MSETHKITKSELESMISGAVTNAVADVKSENEKLKADLESVKNKDTESNEKAMPFFDEYRQKRNDDYASINFNFRPKEFSDQWFLEATPEQRFLAMLKGLKEEKESLIVNAHALGNLVVKADGTPARDFSRQERLAAANYISKQMTAGTAGTGGTLVPEDWKQILINCLYKDPTNLLGNMTKWFTNTGNTTRTPTLVGGATVNWKGENEQKPQSTPETGQYTWDPKKQVVRIEATHEFLEDANPDGATMILQEMRRAMELDSIYCFFYGDGVTQPRGINLDIPAANTRFVGGVFDGDDIKDLKCLVRQDWRQGGWFYAHDCIWCEIEKFQSVLGYLWQQGMNDQFQEGVPPRIIGYPYYRGVDDTMPIAQAQTGTGTGDYGHMFFGKPGNYIMVIRSEFVVRYDPNFAFDYDRASFILESRWDGRMICDTFSKLEGVTC